MDTYPKGLVGTQHPAVLDDHPVVSAQSQLSTCEDARPQGCAPPPGDAGGFGGQSIYSRPTRQFLAHA